jgi:hypothetical protein
VDYNLFHILDAEHITAEALPEVLPSLHMEPPNTVFVVMSNDEAAATEVWKTLEAEAVPNVYILEGGVNNWLNIFAGGELPEREAAPGQLAYQFDAALGARHHAAEPLPEYFNLVYVPKVKLELKRGPTSGGCG